MGLCEFGGGHLVWGWLRDNKPILWGLVGAVVLALYGGVFIALAILWSMLVDDFVPDRYDIIGAIPALSGVAVMVFGPRG